MIEMGDNVSVTQGVTILTHGYDWSVLKGKYGDVLGSAGHVRIGSNVFIGVNATILKGVTIGDNVVIGANSLINKDVPSDCVVVGNPQRVVCTIDEYLEKRRRAQLLEAADLYDCWRRNSSDGKRDEVPPRELFSEFFWLFEDRRVLGTGWSDPAFEGTMRLRGTYEKSCERFAQLEPAFQSYEEFIGRLEELRRSVESND
ncbi:acyltransferase [Enorma massiliensis]|nr:acyltransferase [Enorma massiliensis]